MDIWWQENQCHSFQDQISYPYVLWLLDVIPDHIIMQQVQNNKIIGVRQNHTITNYGS